MQKTSNDQVIIQLSGGAAAGVDSPAAMARLCLMRIADPRDEKQLRDAIEYLQAERAAGRLAFDSEIGG